jgi:hypothetical protein
VPNGAKETPQEQAKKARKQKTDSSPVEESTTTVGGEEIEKDKDDEVSEQQVLKSETEKPDGLAPDGDTAQEVKGIEVRAEEHPKGAESNVQQTGVLSAHTKFRRRRR